MEVEKCTKAQEHDFSPVHLALHHPQPPEHPQGHQTMCPWVSLQESHPRACPLRIPSLTISSLPSLPGAPGPELNCPSVLCPSPSLSARWVLQKGRQQRLKKYWDTGKNDKSHMIFWSASVPKKGFRQDFGLWQCWSL